MNAPELLALAERAERIALNLTRRAFRSPIEWDDKDLADAASAFTVSASLRALASCDSGSDRNGEDPRSGAEGEASQSGPKGIAQNPVGEQP